MATNQKGRGGEEPASPQDFQQQLQALRAEHAAELQALRAEHQQQLDALRAEHQQQLDALRAQAESRERVLLQELHALCRPGQDPEEVQPAEGLGPGEVEVTALSTVWYRGQQVLKGTQCRIAQIDYEKDRGRCWATDRDLRALATDKQVPTAEKKEEDRVFWDRVRQMGEERKKQQLVSARIAEEQADQQRQLAAQARDLAEKQAR